MNSAVRRALGVLVALLVTVAIAALTRLPYDAAPEEALLRLSWRAPGEFTEECRRLSEEELAQLPVHMRREEVCERRPLPYLLRVSLDGRPLVERRVEPAGARRDRPLYVFEEMLLAPGDYRLEVRWEPERAATADPRSSTGGAGDGGTLTLDATLRLRPRDIALITYDTDRRALAARGAATETRTR